PALPEMLESPERSQRAFAAAALWQIDSATQPRVLPVLTEVLREPDYASGPAVLRALARIGPAAKETVPWVADAVKHSQPAIRVEAALALWRITGQTERTLPVLLDAFDERFYYGSRQAGVQALGDMGPAAKVAVPRRGEALQ